MINIIFAPPDMKIFYNKNKTFYEQNSNSDSTNFVLKVLVVNKVSFNKANCLDN